MTVVTVDVAYCEEPRGHMLDTNKYSNKCPLLSLLLQSIVCRKGGIFLWVFPNLIGSSCY